MSRFAGLEIQRRTLRLAIFEGTPKKYALVDFIEEEIDSESPEERRQVVSDLLSDVLSKKENQGLEIVSGIDARETILREITVPYIKDEAIAKTIKFEAESYIHSQSIDDVIIEYVKCGEIENGSRLIMCAVPKNRLLAHLDMLQAGQVDPVSVELDATALATSFANTPLYSGEQNVLMVELQPEYSRLVFLEKDRVVKIRSFWNRTRVVERVDRLLPADTTDADEPSTDPAHTHAHEPGDAGLTNIERRFEEIEKSLFDFDAQERELGAEEIPIAVISDEDYERLTDMERRDLAAAPTELSLSGGETATATVPVISGQGDPLDRLILEIERTFAAYVLSNPIDLIVVTGQCAEELEAVDRLAEYFEVDVVPFDISDSFPIPWEGDTSALNARGAVACGLGLAALGHQLTAFDLRKEEFRFERRFQRLMPALTLLGFLLCVTALVWSVKLYNDSSLLKQEILVLQMKQAEYFEAFFNEKPKMPTPESPLPILAQANKVLSDHGGGKQSSKSDLKKFLNPLEVLADLLEPISKAKPPVYPQYKSFDLNLLVSERSKSSVKLGVQDNAENQRIHQSLKTGMKLFSAQVTYTTRTKGNESNIDLTLKSSVVRERTK